jgi:hypothetical protein
MEVRMSRFTPIVVLAGLTGIWPVSGSRPLPNSGPPKAEELVGTWTGPFKTDMGNGEATLVVTKKDAYAATFDIKVQHPVTMGEVTDLKVGERTISWSQHVMDSDCKAEGTLNDGVLKGEMNCGTMIVTFSLMKS